MPDNHTQPSQQVPVAMTDDQIRKLAHANGIAELMSDNMLHGVMTGYIDQRILKFARDLLAQSAPDAGLAEDAKRFLQQDDLDALCRINANFEDGEGYMETKETMNRLAEIGVVSSTGFGRYFVTAFGSLCLNERGLPLRTSAEHNKREAEGLMLYNKDGFNGTAWINLSEESRETWRERAALASQEPQHD